jgi:hypothetical protein
MTLEYSNATRHAQNEGLITYAGTNALFNLYSGTQPANANTAITSQVLLVSMPISGVFGTDVNGTLTLSAVTETNAVGSGTASFFRIFKADNSVIMDGSVGLSGADLILNTVDIAAGQNVDITAGTIIRGNQ